jgi:hypothetical protein
MIILNMLDLMSISEFRWTSFIKAELNKFVALVLCCLIKERISMVNMLFSDMILSKIGQWI